jgi:hypothetical protein
MRLDLRIDGARLVPRSLLVVVVAVALCGMAAILVLPAAGAQAAGETVSFSPSHGSPGDKVAVTGTGWIAGQVEIYADVSESSATANRIGTATAEKNGTLSSGVLTVPSRDPRGYVFYACENCELGKGGAARQQFTIDPRVDPQLSLVPTSGGPGAGVVASGSGWLPDVEVLVFADRSEITEPGAALARRSADEAGTFSASFAVPQRDRGAYQFIACQRCGDPDGYPQASASFRITAVPPTTTTPPAAAAALTITPSSGNRGQTVIASGAGWLPGRGQVMVFARKGDRTDASRALLVVEPRANGTFGTSLTVPNVPVGRHRFYACQACGDPRGPSDTARFTITAAPVLSIVPGTGQRGDAVTASGTGWLAGRGPVLLFAEQADISDPDSVLAVAQLDAAGAFSISLTVPPRDAASYDFVACQSCGDSAGFPLATAAFTITVPPGFPWLTTAIVLAVLLLVGGVAARRVRRWFQQRTARPRFVVEPDVTAAVEPREVRGVPLPDVRLVSHHDGSAVIERVEVRQ